jgi:hypothetical protein
VSTPADAPDDVVPGSSGAFFIGWRASQAFDNQMFAPVPLLPCFWYILSCANPKEARRSAVQGRRQNPRQPAYGKIEDAVVRAVIHD